MNDKSGNGRPRSSGDYENTVNQIINKNRCMSFRAVYADSVFQYKKMTLNDWSYAEIMTAVFSKLTHDNSARITNQFCH